MKLKLPVIFAGAAAGALALIVVNVQKENQSRAELESQERAVAESYGFGDNRAREDAYNTRVILEGDYGKAEYSLVSKTIIDRNGQRYWLDGPMSEHTPPALYDSFNRVRENFCTRVEAGKVEPTPNARVICDIN